MAELGDIPVAVVSEERAIYGAMRTVVPYRMDARAIRAVERMVTDCEVLRCQLELLIRRIREEHHVMGVAARVLANAVDAEAELRRIVENGRSILDGAREGDRLY